MTDENATEAKLAKQKCFERLVVVDNMPMTPTRRIMTRQPRLLDSTRDLAMLYIVYQIDGPDSPEIRAATRDAHFKYLDEHEDPATTQVVRTENVSPSLPIGTDSLTLTSSTRARAPPRFSSSSERRCSR